MMSQNGRRRIVITGIGMLTPLGNDAESTWDGLLAGRSGAAPITQFDASQYGTTFACEVKDFDDVIAANLKGCFNTCRAAARGMMRRRSGAIVNVSSVVGLHGNPGQTNYAASKAGIIGFTKALARELGNRGVRANVVAPGYVDTRLTQVIADDLKQAMLANTPLGRFGTAEDVASAVRFLCSDEASFITGEVLLVDGGLGM